jgi:hypothetical protein
MNTYLLALSCVLLCLNVAVAEAPPTEVPPAPEVSAAKAIALADAYVAEKFPKNASLYCQSVRLQDSVMRPVRAYRHWDLVYRHAGAKRVVDPKPGAETFGDFHVYVTMGKEVSHEE